MRWATDIFNRPLFLLSEKSYFCTAINQKYIMYKILKKGYLAPAICLMEVYAPRVANAARPGQFLIVKAGDRSERIPLTICDYSPENGTVTIVTQEVGASTKMICGYSVGDSFEAVVGPLGQPSEFVGMDQKLLEEERFLFVAGGLGTAPIYPQVKYLHDRGAKVDVIIGARNSELVIMEKEVSAVCDNLYICTDDGSKGEKGLVTDVMERLVVGGDRYTQVVSIGPMVMMKFVTKKAAEHSLPITVSLNTLMVDGTGMCGACRVTVAGETKFACVDGPEFNGVDVDFDEAIRRQGMYRDVEQERDHKCRIGLH